MEKDSSAYLPLVPSPCRGLCYCNEDNVCTGCGRTRDEVLNWLEMTNDQKLDCKEKSKKRLQKIIEENRDENTKPSVQSKLF